MNKLLVIYHANCIDGFMSAVLIWRKYGFEGAEYIAANYGEPPPNVTDRAVLMVDFSYPRDIILEMAKTARSIIILDHHETAEKELINLPDNVQAVFDMDKSGAGLTWQYLTATPMPKLVQYVQDRDLWRFEFPATKAAVAALASYPWDFKIWSDILDRVSTGPLVTEGMAILRSQNQQIDQFIASSRMSYHIGGFIVPAVNAPPVWASDIGHKLCEGVPFVAIFWDDEKGRNFSLRSSRNGGIHVGDLAKQLGGGGHKHSAGFSIFGYRSPASNIAPQYFRSTSSCVPVHGRNTFERVGPEEEAAIDAAAGVKKD